MLYDVNRIAGFYHLVEQADEMAHVFQVKAVGGFVDDEDFALLAQM